MVPFFFKFLKAPHKRKIKFSEEGVALQRRGCRCSCKMNLLNEISAVDGGCCIHEKENFKG